MNDLKFAFRQLLKSPGFTAAAVLTLGLAIGVNTAIFALVNGAILKPIVAQDPDSIVAVFTGRKGAEGGYRQFSHAEYQSLRETKEVFTDVCALGFTLAGVGKDIESQKRSFAFYVSDNYFALHGANLTLGRGFSAAESTPGANIPVAVISHAYWRVLGGADSLVGSTLRINGDAYTIIGVAPRGFSGTHALVAPDVWLPLGIYSQLSSQWTEGSADLANPRTYALNILGRLAPGVTLSNATTRLPVLDQRLNALALPESGGPRALIVQKPSRFNISTAPDDDDATSVMGVVFLSLAAIVLLIACLNLANMLLARGAARRKEIALRLALGAGRGRVIRQLLVEGFVLAILGGLVGLGLSYWANTLLLSSMRGVFEAMSFSFNLVVDFTPDRTALLATFAFCLIATLIFSLGPALNLTKVDLANDLKQQSGEFAASPSHRLFSPRHILVMAQLALSLALVFSAALFFRGGAMAAAADPGFTTKGGVVAELDYSLSRLKGSDALPRLIRLRDRIAAMPGVAVVAVNTMVPYINNTNTKRILRASDPVDATPGPGEKQGASGVYHVVTTGLFRSIGIPILEGRDFTPAESDTPGAPRTIIIDEKVAKKLYPNGGAIGQRVKYLAAAPDGTRPEMEIIGVVRNTRHDVFGNEAHAHLYVPLAQAPEASVYFQIRLANESPAAGSAFLPVLRREMVSAESDLPLQSISTFANVVDRNFGGWVIRAGAALFAAFGGAALLIAAIGVYGVHAYAVSRRTREIGIRMSLGARPADVFQLIMSQGAKQTAVALGIGIVFALGAGQLIASILFRVSPYDPLALGGAILVLGAAALLACFFPARRATRLNPMSALRME